jgi:hypothetical protein
MIKEKRRKEKEKKKKKNSYYLQELLPSSHLIHPSINYKPLPFPLASH